MLKVTVRGLLAHKVRFIATALAVLIGVAFMAGTQVFTDTFSKSFDDIFVDVNRGTDAVVRSNQTVKSDFGEQRTRISQDVLPEVRQVSGVAAADGAIRGVINIVGRDGKPIADPNAGPPAFGLNWVDDEQLSQWRLVEGSAPRAPDEVVLDKKTASDTGYQLGDTVPLLAGQGVTAPFRLVGIATFGKLDNFSGSSAALVATETAQRLFAEPGKFDWIAVAGGPGLSQTDLVERLDAARLPADTEVITGAAFTKESQDIFRKAIGTFKTVLVAFALVSLFVGAFIIYNTFSIIVAQRTKEIALLRAVGAGRRQVLGSVFLEALGVGIFASALGVGAGILLAIGLRSGLRGLGLTLPATAPVVSTTTIVSSLVLGIVVTLVAAVFPARRAASVPPVAAMRDVAIDVSGRSRVRLVMGLLVTLAGGGFLYTGLVGRPSDALSFVGVGAFLVFVGVAVLGPTFAGPLSRVIGAPFARLGVTGRLAQENAVRNPKRTASTASALMIGVGLVSFFAIAGQSVKASAGQAIDRTINGDIVIDSQTRGFGGLSPQLVTDVQAVPGVRTAAGIRAGLGEINGSGKFLLAFDPATLPKIVRFDVHDGDLAALGTDGVAIPEALAIDKGLTVGSTVPIKFQLTGEQSFRVAAIYTTDLPLRGGGYLISDAGFDQNYPENERVESQIYVALEPGADPAAARSAIEDIAAAYPTAKVQDLTEFKRAQEKQVDQLLVVITLLLVLSLLIAVIGIINTLLLSVYERTREIGLLRAVGETRGQLRRSIALESVIIALLGTMLGVVIGLAFAWALVRALADQQLNVFAVPVGQLIVYVIVAIIIGVLAAIYPAYRAGRMNVLAAIATE